MDLVAAITWFAVGGSATLAFEHWVLPWAMLVAARRANRARRVR